MLFSAYFEPYRAWRIPNSPGGAGEKFPLFDRKLKYFYSGSDEIARRAPFQAGTKLAVPSDVFNCPDKFLS